MRLANTVKDIYIIITSLQKRLLYIQRFLRFAGLKKIDENIMKRIKSFFKEHAKIINDILKSTQKAYDFFEQKYLTLVRRIFFYIDDNLFTPKFIN